MTENNGLLNLNRAVCVAAAAGMEAETKSGGLMEGIYLKDYVKSLEDVQPSQIPRPTFDSYIKSLKVKSRPIPQEPLVHIKVTHTAINHVDLLYAHGVHQNNKSGLFSPPFTLGLEFSGIVLAVQPSPSSSKSQSSFKPGDKVWGGSIGTHAEELILPASAIHPLPNTTWSLHNMAALGAATFPVSYGAMTTIAGVKAGETVLIHAAAGGLGVYAVQIARALGARVIGTVGSAHKVAIVEELLRDPNSKQVPAGEGVVNYSHDGWEKQVTALCKQVGKDGVDVVYDTVGLVTKSIRCTTFGGRIVIAGFAGRTGTGAEKVDELEKVAVNRILLKQIKLLGYRYGETSRRLPGETVKMWKGLNEMMAREPCPIRPVVYQTYKGLGRANEAMKALHERKVYGKAVLEICPEDEAMEEVLRRAEHEGRGSLSARL